MGRESAHIGETFKKGGDIVLKKNVIRGFAQAIGITSDAAIAARLGIDRTALSSAMNRGTNSLKLAFSLYVLAKEAKPDLHFEDILHQVTEVSEPIQRKD